MWSEGDTVALGLSGGKDSFVLLHLLLAAKSLGLPGCKVAAFHLPPPSACACAPSAKRIPDWLNALPLDTFERLNGDLKEDEPCERCSRIRRRSLLEICQKHKINILVLAHHRDDLIQTYLLNLLFHGKATGTIQPVRLYDGGTIRLVRPFLTTPEKRIIALARKLGYSFDSEGLPPQPKGKRGYIRQFLSGLGTSRDVVKTNLSRLAVKDWPEPEGLKSETADSPSEDEDEPAV